MKHYYYKIILSSLIILFFSIDVSGQDNKALWTKTSKESVSKSQLVIRKSEPVKASYYKLDINGLKNILRNAPNRKGFNGISNVIVSFPNADETLESYRILEASVMHPTLQAKYPNIRSYVGQSIENPATSIRISVTPQGLHTMTLSSNKGRQFIDPYSRNDNSYIIYSKKDLPALKDEFICGVMEEISSEQNNNRTSASNNANDGKMRDFRLALASTIEYSQFHYEAAGLDILDLEADKKAAVLAAMVVTMNRVNGIYERDLSITMTLIANNEDIIFVGNSDPYNNNNGSTMLGQNQTEIDNTIGTANYDIGHVFSTAGGGIASLGIPCVDGIKARGVTGLSMPVGDGYDIDFVAHEMGHQFGANHTFNGNTDSCGSQRNASTAYEPGSGSTIMAYAGICSGQNVQSNSDAYFHQQSLTEIWAYVTTGSGTCAAKTDTNNSAPTAMAGNDYSIPIGTPYKLTGSSSDVESTSTHTFTWEQFDLGAAGLPTELTATGPLVRTFEGTANPVRYIPRLSDVISNGGVSTTWEKLSTIGRSINFKLTVRDNDVAGGQTHADGMVITTVAAAGPFTVTSQATPQIIWTPGATKTINWNVAGTDANGVNTANVNILLSSDGGVTFDRVLAANTPNDGTHDIVVPSDITAPMCRVMVQGAGNIFYAVNSEFFAVGNYSYQPGDVCKDYVFNFGIPIPVNTSQYSGYALTVNDSETISDVNINVNMTHNNIGELYYGFGAPFEAASVVNELQSGTCGGSVNIDFTFDDEGSGINCASTANGDFVIPLEPLSVADGTDSAGDWIFWITDLVDNGVSGVINSVTLTICHTESVLTLGAEDLTFEKESFSVYPNPNHGEFTVKLNSNSGNKINISVFDLRGRRVFDNVYSNSLNLKEVINLNNVQSGMYILRVNDGERSSTKKIIIN